MAVIDTAQNKVLGTIPVPKGPHGLVVTPDGLKVYVSSDGASTVSVIDTANDRVVGSIDAGANPHGLAVSGDGSRVLVMGWGWNRVLVIDTATDRVIGEIPVAQPHNGTLSGDGRTGWVASQQQGATGLARLDLTAWKETSRVPLDKTPRGLELSPDGRRIFFTLAGVNAIQVLDTATGQIVAQIPVGASPHYAPFTPDGRQALAVVQGPGELAILDTASNTLAGTVAVGKAPHWIMPSADGRTAYVTNEGSNDVSVVDLANRTVTATIAAGNAPRKIAAQAAAGAAATSPAPGRATAAPAGKGKSVTRGGVTYADHGTKDLRNLSKLELEADDYYFSPTSLRGNPGQTLTLIVESEAATLRNLSIPALGIERSTADRRHRAQRGALAGPGPRPAAREGDGAMEPSAWVNVSMGVRRLLLVTCLVAFSAGVAWAAGPADVARGKYVFGAAAGCGCHTEPKGQTNAGGRKFEGPFGTVYAANITPDRPTGIGGWTDEQIITAIRSGRRPNGERILPVHPFTSFNGMAEEDLKALVAFLRTVSPVHRTTPPKKITVPMFERVFLPVWLTAFASKETPPPAAPVSGLPRGEYLVRAVGHCGECHTPRSALTMAVDNSRLFAGNSKKTGPEGQAAPNITPDKGTGIGDWTEEQIVTYLGTGNRPDGDVAGGLMGENIQGTLAGYKDMTNADLRSIAQYLKSIPAVKNKIE